MKSKKMVRTLSAPVPVTAITPAPEPCDRALAIARAELTALREQAEDTAARLLFGLADVKTMTAGEILEACRVSLVRIQALQTTALQALALE